MPYSLTNALKFEALMCAAYEVIRYAKDEYVGVAMEKLNHLPRKERREHEKLFRDSFNNLHRTLYQFTDVVERHNPEFFDRVVDSLLETVSNPEVIKWRKNELD